MHFVLSPPARGASKDLSAPQQRKFLDRKIVRCTGPVPCSFRGTRNEHAKPESTVVEVGCVRDTPFHHLALNICFQIVVLEHALLVMRFHKVADRDQAEKVLALHDRQVTHAAFGH